MIFYGNEMKLLWKYDDFKVVPLRVYIIKLTSHVTCVARSCMPTFYVKLSLSINPDVSYRPFARPCKNYTCLFLNLILKARK